MEVKTSAKPELKSITEKVAGKMVRVLTKDGREYLACFGSIDKTGALFLQDSLEIIDTNFDRPDCKDLYHECYTPYLLNKPQGDNSLVYKLQGNVVIKREHVIKIYLDKKA